MLSLIGLGLYDEKDLTLRGIEEAKKSDKVYIELYTGKWHGSIEGLSSTIGKEIVQLKRNDLEENSKKILEEAVTRRVVIFVQGDPLVATTHSSLLVEAKKQKIEIKVIHNTSIISAIAETGLHIYKFGQTVTIPFPEKTGGKLPQSVYDAIGDNQSRGLHTLCLLDVVAEDDRYLGVKQALGTLLVLEEANKKHFVTNGSKAVIFSITKNSNITYGTIEKLIKEVFQLPAVVVIPGKLHFSEKEHLKLYEI